MEMDIGEFYRQVGRHSIFTMTFYKRDPKTKEPTGEFRRMAARFGVTRHLRGGVLPYNPKKKNLMGPVYDMIGDPDRADGGKPGYKMINLEGLVELKWKGRTWHWEPEAQKFFS